MQVLTVGQYLRPSERHLPVVRYWHPDEFAALEQAAYELGFDHVAAGPLVRSSYHADQHVPQTARGRRTARGARVARCGSATAAHRPGRHRIARRRRAGRLTRSVPIADHIQRSRRLA